MTRWFLGLTLLFLIGMAPADARTTIWSTVLNDLRQLDGAVEIFGLEHKRLPSEMEGLEAVKQWVRGNTVPLDPWGNPYVYRRPGYFGTNAYEIYSMGADGISKTGGGDPDDINLWDPQSKWTKYYAPKPARTPKWTVLLLSGTGLALFCLVAGILGKLFKGSAKNLH